MSGPGLSPQRNLHLHSTGLLRNTVGWETWADYGLGAEPWRPQADEPGRGLYRRGGGAWNPERKPCREGFSAKAAVGGNRENGSGKVWKPVLETQNSGRHAKSEPTPQHRPLTFTCEPVASASSGMVPCPCKRNLRGSRIASSRGT